MPPKENDKNKIQSEVDALVHSTSPKEKEVLHYTANPDLKALRTFAGDVEETIHNKQTSVAKVFVAEQKKKEIPKPKPEKLDTFPAEKKTLIKNFSIKWLLPLAGIVLFLGGAAALIYMYYNLTSNTTPIKVVLNQSIIPYSEKSDTNLPTKFVNKAARAQIIKTFGDQARSYNKPAGSVLYLEFLSDKNILPTAIFFRNIAASAPSSLPRAFGEKYMSGIYSFDTNATFLLLSIDDYGSVYSGMLKWESGIISDLSQIFSLDNLLNGSTTPIFQDDSFNNQDVRILRNASGEIVFVYGFMDKSLLIMTKNENVYQALANKYRNSKLVR